MDFESLWDDLSIGRIEQYLSEGDVNRRSSQGGKTLLHIAVDCRRADLVAFLIERGADLDAIEDRGWTPLHLAVDTALDGAIQNDRPADLDLARALVRAGAREDLRTGEGQTPRDLAALYGPRALSLYDRISRLDSRGEPSLDDFFERGRAALKIAGFHVADAGGQQLVVAETAQDAADPWRRTLVATNRLYHRRHEHGFPEALVAEIRAELARLQQQRGDR